MAEPAERICAVCGNLMSSPRQNNSVEDLLCMLCTQVRRYARSHDNSFDTQDDFGAQGANRPDYDVHPPGAM